MENDFSFIGPITQLISLTGLPLNGPLPGSLLKPLSQAGILLKGNLIHKIGRYDDLKKSAIELNAVFTVIEEDFICLPGFVDAHTHICFAGSRSADYALRNEGKSYLEIAAAGGGIWDTVSHTREAKQEQLTDLVAQRANRHLQEGVTTIEVKSGYGLSVNEELKLLRAIQNAKAHTKASLISTCLAAHTMPKDFPGSSSEYLLDILQNLLPQVREEKLSNRVDIFVEKGAFSLLEAESYLIQARQKGFGITIHADQFSTGGSALAVQLGALSADHLEASTNKEIALLSDSPTAAVVLPGASVGLGCRFAPARRLLDRGASLAIASDWNPGTAPMGDLLTLAALLGVFEKLSDVEVFAGITFRAAAALGLVNRGRLAPDCLADFVLFQGRDYREILYLQGKLKPAQVWKLGKRVF